MITDAKLREDMIYLLGQMQAISFPIVWTDGSDANHAYYDLIDSINLQYKDILKRTIGYQGSD